MKIVISETIRELGIIEFISRPQMIVEWPTIIKEFIVCQLCHHLSCLELNTLAFLLVGVCRTPWGEHRGAVGKPNVDNRDQSIPQKSPH